jgi:hypothetical protein
MSEPTTREQITGSKKKLEEKTQSGRGKMSQSERGDGSKKREQSQKEKVGGIVEGTTSQKKTLWNGSPMHRLRRCQLCVRNDEAEERDGPSSLPGDAVEVGVQVLLLDLGQEVPARGAISNVVTG